MNTAERSTMLAVGDRVMAWPFVNAVCHLMSIFYTASRSKLSIIDSAAIRMEESIGQIANFPIVTTVLDNAMVTNVLTTMTYMANRTIDMVEIYCPIVKEKSFDSIGQYFVCPLGKNVTKRIRSTVTDIISALPSARSPIDYMLDIADSMLFAKQPVNAHSMSLIDRVRLHALNARRVMTSCTGDIYKVIRERASKVTPITVFIFTIRTPLVLLGRALNMLGPACKSIGAYVRMLSEQLGEATSMMDLVSVTRTTIFDIYMFTITAVRHYSFEFVMRLCNEIGVSEMIRAEMETKDKAEDISDVTNSDAEMSSDDSFNN